MAFGFFKKDKNTGPIEVTCPLCEHSQQESPLAVSSYCKGCKAYLSFEKTGEITARAQASPDPFAHRPAQPKIDIEYKAREEAPITPAAKKATPAPAVTKPAPAATKPAPAATKPAPAATKPAPAATKPAPAAPAPAAPAPAATKPAPAAPAPAPAAQEQEQEQEQTQEDLPEIKPLLGSAEGEDTKAAIASQSDGEPEELAPRYHRQSDDAEAPSERSLKKKAAHERLVACFECGDAHVANARANSTQCRKCGRLISLQDQHIKEPWSSRIQTRGNVYIHKKGIVSGASIQCHNLVVEGDFTGSAECSGDLTLRRHGKIVGNVICDRLLVEKRAKVEFLNLVEMNECKIDGIVTGNISCRGLLALEKKATLTGNIRVGSLTVADGAKHSGQIQMGAF